MTIRPSFSSDNHFGAHPAVLEAMARVNDGPATAYGADTVTERAVEQLRGLFGPEVGVFFVFNGTAANVLGLQALVRPWEAVICAAGAHIAVDECGAPEHFAVAKLLAVEALDGKVTPGAVEQQLGRVGDQHAVQPRVVSISQTTEYGTVYSLAELREMAAVVRANGLRFHMDGSRLANAAAALGCSLAAMTTDVGVDVVTFGGTKNGAVAAEAVVLLDPSLAADFPYIRKQGMQLASKMRFLSAQFLALLEDDRYLVSARHANAMAQRLASGVAGLSAVQLTQPVEANGIFAVLPTVLRLALQAEFRFELWDDSKEEVRWMTSWATTEAEVDHFVMRIRELARG
ncbi:MAG: low specificity L-threonine aldolase [Gemmatimonadota bacterium]|nr:low specificity L-threonine aldolase [Gemmatimonadota bacterium]